MATADLTVVCLRVTTWSDKITEIALDELQKLSDNFKYAVSCIIMQKNGAGIATAGRWVVQVGAAPRRPLTPPPAACSGWGGSKGASALTPPPVIHAARIGTQRRMRLHRWSGKRVARSSAC